MEDNIRRSIVAQSFPQKTAMTEALRVTLGRTKGSCDSAKGED